MNILHSAECSLSKGRFFVHANIAFRSGEDPFLRQFTDAIRPSYTPPTRYVLSHRLLDAEISRVDVEEIARLHKRKRLTLLIDGWEDRLRRELYGSVAVEVSYSSILLSLFHSPQIRSISIQQY